jgi:hypothetical protein
MLLVQQIVKKSWNVVLNENMTMDNAKESQSFNHVH